MKGIFGGKSKADGIPHAAQGRPRNGTLKEYKILFDRGTARKLEEQVNLMAKEGWRAVSIGASQHLVFVLMERET